MFLDGEMRLVGPGDAIAIPPGRIHSIENICATELIFLCCCAPGYEHEDAILVS
jgi:mannose-6-phosphate isomerase-like protein (cupin superfamily)